MTDEQNDKRNLESWRDIPSFSANELTETARRVWREGYESGVADSADEIERLRAQLAIFTPSEIRAAHERRTATDV